MDRDFEAIEYDVFVVVVVDVGVVGMIVLNDLIGQNERIQVLEILDEIGGEIQQLRPCVLFGRVLPLELGPFSTKRISEQSKTQHLPGHISIKRWLTLFLLRYQSATTPRMTRAATTGPAMTPGLIDLPPELADGIHSIDGHWLQDLSRSVPASLSFHVESGEWMMMPCD